MASKADLKLIAKAPHAVMMVATRLWEFGTTTNSKPEEVE